LAAAALLRLYERGGEIALFGSHPPGDVAFREDLMKAVVGYWHVEHGGKERAFKVAYANTFDEPAGGLMNVVLSEDGGTTNAPTSTGGGHWRSTSAVTPPTGWPSTPVGRWITPWRRAPPSVSRKW
jgi:hypothetical protein